MEEQCVINNLENSEVKSYIKDIMKDNLEGNVKVFKSDKNQKKDFLEVYASFYQDKGISFKFNLILGVLVISTILGLSSFGSYLVRRQGVPMLGAVATLIGLYFVIVGLPYYFGSKYIEDKITGELKSKKEEFITISDDVLSYNYVYKNKEVCEFRGLVMDLCDLKKVGYNKELNSYYFRGRVKNIHTNEIDEEGRIDIYYYYPNAQDEVDLAIDRLKDKESKWSEIIARIDE